MPMYDKQCVERFSQLFNWSTVDAEDIDDDKYLFAKKFSEVRNCSAQMPVCILIVTDNFSSGQLPGQEVSLPSPWSRYPALSSVPYSSHSEPESGCFHSRSGDLDQAPQ